MNGIDGPNALTFTVVIATLGRSRELVPLLESLRKQSVQNFEIIIVDQNNDDRVAEVILPFDSGLAITRLHTPQSRGLSRARNAGWRQSRGNYVVFADDDCWYPDAFFETTRRIITKTSADIVCGRAADEAGRSINGRYEARSQAVTRDNVWTTSIEWVAIFKRDVLAALNGYDEDIGVGASTPWQAAEGQDLLLRALKAGYNIQFDYDLCGHHPELDVKTPDAAMLAKARVYGRGMGYVLRKHGFGAASLVRWVGRPAGAVLLFAARGERSRASYYLSVAQGRIEGYLGRNRGRGWG